MRELAYSVERLAYRIKILIFLFCLYVLRSTLFPISCWAAFSNKDAGTTSGQILKLAPDASSAAMGEALTAQTHGSSALFLNPAGLMSYYENEPIASVHLMHAAWFESINYDVITLARPLTEWSALGVGVAMLSWGSFDSLDNAGNKVGTISARDLVLALGLTQRSDTLDWGLAIKRLDSKILASASTLTIDVGLQKSLATWRFGATAQNMGGSLKFHQISNDLPLTIKAGAAKKILPNWIAEADIHLPKNHDPWFAAGTQYQWFLNENSSLAGRLGYNTRSLETKELNGISFGLGFNYQHISVDYAFVPFGMLGETHRLSLGFLW